MTNGRAKYLRRLIDYLATELPLCTSWEQRRSVKRAIRELEWELSQ